MTTLDLPGEPTLFRTVNIPPERVQLPLQAGPRRSLLLLLAIPFAMVGFSAILLLWGFSSVSKERPPEIIEYVILLLFCPTFLIGLPVAFTCMVDAARRHPVLVISTEGLQDRRTRGFVPWRSISRAMVTYTRGGVGGVHLKLKAAIPAQQNPFRLGTLWFFWSRRADELHVPLLLLDVKSRTLAYAILILVRMNDGEVETRSPVSDVIGDPMPMPRYGDQT